MLSQPYGGSDAVLVDRVIGNAYNIVKEVQENLAMLTVVSLIAGDITQVIENLNGVQSTLQTLLASTVGAGQVGTSEVGINVQEALEFRPTAVQLAALNAAAGIGTSTVDINVQEALDARPTSVLLAEDTGAASIGTALAWGTSVATALAALVPIFATSVQLQSIAHVSNTATKFAGRLAFNSTDQKLYIAQGAANVSVWRSADGLDELNPV